jgi:molecular chaperone GrpE
VSKKTAKDTKRHEEGKRESTGSPAESEAMVGARDHQAVDEVLEADEDGVYELPDEEGGAAKSVEQRLEDQRRQLEEAQDRALRFQAELENYRKRMTRQMEDERRFAHMSLVRDLLPVWDNMGRAIEAAEKNHDVTSLLEGFKMVTRQIEDVLKRHHCVPIDALGQPFDPHFHEAISQQPSDEHPANTVTHVAQTGFQLHDRVVRPSQVVVSAAGPSAKEKTDAEETTRTESSAN